MENHRENQAPNFQELEESGEKMSQRQQAREIQELERQVN